MREKGPSGSVSGVVRVVGQFEGALHESFRE